MKNNTLIDILKDVGLTENEAMVYFGALTLGPTTIANIAKAANVKRTTTYSVVESLKQKGIMSVEIK